VKLNNLSLEIEKRVLVNSLRSRKISFKSAVLQKYGPLLLEETLNICKSINLKPFLVFGTLLGHYRDNNFIKHDNDIDLGILNDDWKKIDRLKSEMVKKGYIIKREEPDFITFAKPNYLKLSIDFWLFFKEDELFFYRYKSHNGENIYSFKYYFPSKIFESFKEVLFLNKIKILIPENTEDFLSNCYGNWKIPFSQFKNDWSHPNIDSVDISNSNKGIASVEIQLTDNKSTNIMKPKTFNKIVHELSKLHYNGRISLYIYGKSYFEKEGIEYIKLIRKELPNAFLKIQTDENTVNFELFKNISDYGSYGMIHIHLKNLSKSIIINQLRDTDKDKNIELRRYKALGIVLALSGEQFNDLKKMINYAKSFGFGFYPRYANYYPDYFSLPVYNNPQVTPSIYHKQYFCYAIHGLVIKHDGSVRICSDEENFKLGNVEQKSLIDIWNSPKYKLIRSKFKRDQIRLTSCAECKKEFRTT
jgi:radical SAM protein with 4Fe4S-binding SPASM domain